MGLLRSNHGYGFNFNQEFRPKESRNLNQSACRGSLKIDVLITCFPESRQVRKIEQVGIQLDHVIHGASGSLNGGLEVLKYLPNLCSEIVFTDKVSRFVECNLPGDEYQASLVHPRYLGVTGGLGHCVWDNQLEVIAVHHFSSSLPG
jgi:hypothetical protein